MKRVLCGALLAASAVATLPAEAAEEIEPILSYQLDEYGIGVGTRVGRQPLFGARYDRTTGELCVGFSYQVPQCVGGPIE